MSVQAQYPSHIVLPELCNRIRQSNTSESRNFISTSAFMASGPVEELHLPTPANLLRVYNSSLNLADEAMPNIGVLNEVINDPTTRSMKRARDGEDLPEIPHVFLPLLDLQQQHQINVATAFAIPQGAATISTSLRLSTDDARINPASVFNNARNNVLSFSSILREELQSEMMKQKEEIDQFIIFQGERMKHALEEKRQRHTRCLLATIEEGVLKRLKIKEMELEKVNRRNLELQERVKQLSLESQLWQNMAKNNEVLVSNLRTSLENVGETEDAESCHYGEVGQVHTRVFKENKELKEKRTCRACRSNIVCILLLPCRHLCLCKECESKLDLCPICKSTKSASVQVYMS